MPSHSARRFLLEVVFLGGVAAALTFAELRPAAIIALMAIAWAVVALLEWTAWLDEPHYGRGLPPRYYVPHVALPPPVGVAQGEPAYPILPAVDDEPTFVASTQEWGLAEWPDAEATAFLAEDTVAVPLPPPIPEIEETIEAEILIPEEYDVGEAEPAPEPAPPRTAKPPGSPPVLAMPARVSGTALHRIDPLVSSRRRRFGFRRGGDDAPAVEVLDGPPPDRKVPSRVLEESGRR